MKQVTRHGVFETNSSSVHSLSIEGASHLVTLTITNGELMVEFGEFGWGYDRLDYWYDKLSYVLTAIQYHDTSVTNYETLEQSQFYQWLVELVKDYSGATMGILKDRDNYHTMGYIDHQSTPQEGGDPLEDLWSTDEAEFKSNIKDVIFDAQYVIVIDNDNH